MTISKKRSALFSYDTEVEFWYVIGAKSSEFSFLPFTVTSTYEFYSPQPLNKSGLKLLNIVYLKSHNSQYYAQNLKETVCSWIWLLLALNPGNTRVKLGKNVEQPQCSYIYRVQSSVRRLPNPLSTQRIYPPPAPKGAHTRRRRAVRGLGGNISEDARHWIGLLQYNPSTGAATMWWLKPHRGADRRHHAPQAFMPRLADH